MTIEWDAAGWLRGYVPFWRAKLADGVSATVGSGRGPDGKLTWEAEVIDMALPEGRQRVAMGEFDTQRAARSAAERYDTRARGLSFPRRGQEQGRRDVG